jgi:predicted RNA-binding protein
MQHWIAVTTEDNWQVVKREQMWGVSARYEPTINRTAQGDTLLIYCMGTVTHEETIPPRIPALYTIASAPSHDRTALFAPSYNHEERFPWRVDLDLLKLSTPPVEFTPLIQELSFIKNKARWSGYFRRPLFAIPEEDHERIVRRFRGG